MNPYKRKAVSDENCIKKFFLTSSAINNVEIIEPVPLSFKETLLDLITKSLICSIQRDPFNNNNKFELNKKLIQPLINFPKNHTKRKKFSVWY